MNEIHLLSQDERELFFRADIDIKNMLSAGTREGLLIQALKNLGKDHIDKKMHMQIAKLLKDSTEEEIRKNIKFAPAWIRALIFEILELKP